MKKKSKSFIMVGFWFAVLLYFAFILFPFYWQVICSFKPAGEIFTKPPKIITANITYKNYRDVFASGVPFGLYIKNSFIVALFTTIISVVFGCLAGYALGRIKVPGKNLILAFVLMSSMFPQIAIISPLFLLLRKLSLLNTYPGLVIPYCSFGLPLVIWLMTSFFRDLPQELEDSAKVDGANVTQTMTRIMIPLAAPAIFTSAIIVAIFAWNEFIFSLIFNTKPTMRTVTVGITMFPGLYEIPWGTIFAAATLVVLPLIIMVLILQKRIISGLTAGAVKE